jgi:hypothetical protein
VGAEGDEGSSKGRLADDIAVVEVGDADMFRMAGENHPQRWYEFLESLLLFFR